MIWGSLIGAGVGLILGIIGQVVFPLACDPCAAAFVGLLAGALAGVFDKPADGGASAGKGAGAGAIATIGNLLGQVIGGVINALLVGPQAAAQMAETLGLPPTTGPGSEAGYYLGAIGGPCLCGLVGIALGAALGALGGFLWFQIGGPKDEAPADISYE